MVGDGSLLGRSCNDDVRSPSGPRRRGRVSFDDGCDARDAGSQLGRLRSQLVAHRVDQRVQAATATATLVDAAAAICADLRTAVGAATPATAAMGAAVGHPVMGSGSSAVDLGADLDETARAVITWRMASSGVEPT